MKGGRRTTKGRIINMDDIIASAPHATTVGNMGTNAQGDKLAKGGEISQSREKRTRSYYKNHPQSSNQKVSLKGEMQDAFIQGYNDFSTPKPNTAKTQSENIRTSTKSTTFTEPPAIIVDEPELSEFNDVELPDPQEELETYFSDNESEYETQPDGFEEVELENGDIIIKPYWLDNQDEQDEKDDQ